MLTLHEDERVKITSGVGVESQCISSYLPKMGGVLDEIWLGPSTTSWLQRFPEGNIGLGARDHSLS